MSPSKQSPTAKADGSTNSCDDVCSLIVPENTSISPRFSSGSVSLLMTTKYSGRAEVEITVGISEGEPLGLPNSPSVGTPVGIPEGELSSVSDGMLVGIPVGIPVGISVPSEAKFLGASVSDTGSA